MDETQDHHSLTVSPPRERRVPERASTSVSICSQLISEKLPQGPIYVMAMKRKINHRAACGSCATTDLLVWCRGLLSALFSADLCVGGCSWRHWCLIWGLWLLVCGKKAIFLGSHEQAPDLTFLFCWARPWTDLSGYIASKWAHGWPSGIEEEGER